jgi:hypothetical protein
VTLEGNDPAHFEFALKFMYTLDYSPDISPGTHIGEILTKASTITHRGFAKTSGFTMLLRELPSYGADVVLGMQSRGMFNLRRFECAGCGRWNHVGDSGVSLNVPVRAACWRCGREGSVGGGG